MGDKGDKDSKGDKGDKGDKEHKGESICLVFISFVMVLVGTLTSIGLF